MADRPESPNKVPATCSEDVKEAQSPETYPVLLSVIKSERRTDRSDREAARRKFLEERLRNREFVIEKWMGTQEDPASADPPVDDDAEDKYSIEQSMMMVTVGDISPSAPPATQGRERRKDASEKRKRRSDGKKEGLVIKTEPLDDDKENLSERKPLAVESSPGSAAKGGRYIQAFQNAMEFLKDVKSELFFTNPEAYQEFLDIFEESKHSREDLTDRLRVVAEARDVIGHREDLMQRLVDMAMSDIPVHKSPPPLRPLATSPAENRGVKRRSWDFKVVKSEG